MDVRLVEAHIVGMPTSFFAANLVAQSAVVGLLLAAFCAALTTPALASSRRREPLHQLIAEADLVALVTSEHMANVVNSKGDSGVPSGTQGLTNFRGSRTAAFDVTVRVQRVVMARPGTPKKGAALKVRYTRRLRSSADWGDVFPVGATYLALLKRSGGQWRSLTVKAFTASSFGGPLWRHPQSRGTYWLHITDWYFGGLAFPRQLSLSYGWLHTGLPDDRHDGSLSRFTAWFTLRDFQSVKWSEVAKKDYPDLRENRDVVPPRNIPTYAEALQSGTAATVARCRAGDVGSCVMIGLLYREKLRPGVPSAAILLLAPGCVCGDVRACSPSPKAR